MSTDRDVTRTVRSWLEEGVTALPDRVLDDVLDQLPATPQRRAPWWPAWRLPVMNTTAKLALAAAAILVLAFLGVRYLLPTNVGGPDETPEPTSIPSPEALPAVGALEPGPYVVGAIELPRSFTITVPAGWRTAEGFISKGEGVGPKPEAVGDLFITYWTVTHVFEDACLRPGLDEDSLVEARTPEEIVDALASQGGHETNGPVAVNVGGYPAQRLEFVFPDGYDLAACEDSFLRLWPGPGPDLSSGQAAYIEQRYVIYVVDIDGDAAIVIAGFHKDASSTDVAELEGMLATIRFAEAAAP